MRSYAPQFIFTTTLPPSVAASAAAAVRHLKALERRARAPSGAWRGWSSTRLRAAGLPVLDNPSHIVPVMVRDAAKCKRRERDAARAARHLHPADQLSRPSPRATERLRITPTPRHTEAQVADCWSRRWSTSGRRSGCRSRRPKVVPLAPPGAEAAALRLSGDEEGGRIGRPCARATFHDRRERLVALADRSARTAPGRRCRMDDLSTAAIDLAAAPPKPFSAALSGVRQADAADLADAAGRAATCPNIARSAPRRRRSSTSATRPSSRPRRRCSRSAASASTRRSCSPTFSSCPTRSARASASRPARGRG